MKDVTLSVAELAVLTAAIGIDAAPFVRDTPLTELGAGALRDRLEQARASVIDRGLAQAGTGRPLQVALPVRAVLERLARPQRAFEIMRAERGKPPLRVQISLDAGGAVVMRHDPGDMRSVSVGPNGSAVAELALADMPAWESGAAPVEYSVPGAVVARLATDVDAPEQALEGLLVGAGMDQTAAASFLSIGLRPAQQTVLTALTLAGVRVRAQSILWFADESVCWLLIPVGPAQEAEARFLARRANRDDIRSAIEAMLAAA